jgi:hypothetical protein
LITRVLPESSAGVPVLVERAVFEGKPAVVIVEAVPDQTGKITKPRIWVFTDKGEVLYYATR